MHISKIKALHVSIPRMSDTDPDTQSALWRLAGDARSFRRPEFVSHLKLVFSLNLTACFVRLDLTNMADFCISVCDALEEKRSSVRGCQTCRFERRQREKVCHCMSVAAGW